MMIKYYCDICENEISQGNQIVGSKVGTLDFSNKVVQLCDSCSLKFKEAKESIHDEYETKYLELDEDYLDDLKDEILN